ncbi:hypothetical protein BO82DRAFT_57299 [Aspergillus uvarum CBS 121591]|uniref:Uncharacterized protein n=1 Tax=Aspergillus uvarum CBS 121591 TaxID=1448315 RepID=A0A319DUI7_9EURO|nr:hypothetical protein BO82DRAFT_57299 [Aspergillus uvarum CBS 121591]PYH82812.1 hypothetical protein BO82DRAFT_57299 [Aspergillus uvarum CBS 121591]
MPKVGTKWRSRHLFVFFSPPFPFSTVGIYVFIRGSSHVTQKPLNRGTARPPSSLVSYIGHATCHLRPSSSCHNPEPREVKAVSKSRPVVLTHTRARDSPSLGGSITTCHASSASASANSDRRWEGGEGGVYPRENDMDKRGLVLGGVGSGAVRRVRGRTVTARQVSGPDHHTVHCLTGF